MINSVGDQIERGRYFSHSSFERVVNFYPESENCGLLAVAKNEVGCGPKTITIEDQLFEKAKHSSEILVENDKIQFVTKRGNFVIPLSITRFNSKLDEQTKGIDLGVNIDTAWDMAIHHSPEKSFAFLLDSKREREFTGAFERALVERVKNGETEIFKNGNLESGVKLIKGVGTGLTPSGDDFITGLLAAIAVTETNEQINLENIKQVIKNNALGGNPFSNTYIELASRSHFTEKVLTLLKAILIGEEIESKTRDLIDFGHSSGADLITGILLGLKRRKSWLPKD
ncbi:MAG: DUF2877 domain-containing protein [Bacteriovoracaceae bacterium]|nr:DUF2877 domain-containing protein [Bacteriovoracaceae bacterium]